MAIYLYLFIYNLLAIWSYVINHHSGLPWSVVQCTSIFISFCSSFFSVYRFAYAPMLKKAYIFFSSYQGLFRIHFNNQLFIYQSIYLSIYTFMSIYLLIRYTHNYKHMLHGREKRILASIYLKSARFLTFVCSCTCPFMYVCMC